MESRIHSCLAACRTTGVLCLSGLMLTVCVASCHHDNAPPSASQAGPAAELPPPAPLPQEPLDAPQQVRVMVVEAKALLDRLASDYPSSVESLYARGQIAYLCGENDLAIWYWKRCLSLDPAHSPALVQLGTAYANDGDLELAVEYLSAARRLKPDLPEPGLHLGKALVNLGRYDEAITVLKNQTALQPKSAEVWSLLGQAQFGNQDLRQAQKSYQAALDIDADCRPALHGLAQVGAQLGQTEQANVLRDRLLVVEKERDRAFRANMNAYDDKQTEDHILSLALDVGAAVYAVQGDAARAQAYWRRAGELDPANVECRRGLAKSLSRQNRAAEAIGVLEELRRLEPLNVEYLFALAAQHLQLSQLDAVEKCYLAVLKIDPKNANASSSLAELYLETGQHLPEARRWALQATQLRPTAANFFLLSTACRANADRGGCRAALHEALRLDPQNPEYSRAFDVLEME